MGMYTTQSNNFRLLRCIYGSHESLAQRLQGTVNRTQLSRFTTAEEVANPSIIERIESVLSLPVGWFNRENFAFTKISAEDYDLFSLILDAQPSARSALLHLLKKLRPETKTDIVTTTRKNQN